MSPRLSLYEIVGQYAAFQTAMLSENGEISESAIGMLESIEDDLVNKLANIIRMRANWRSAAESARAEARRLEEFARFLESKVERIEESTIAHLESVGLDGGIVTPAGRISVGHRGKTSFKWAGDGPIPADFARKKVEVSLDWEKANAAYKEDKLPVGFVAKKPKQLSVK